jgi:hypothetical protein
MGGSKSARLHAGFLRLARDQVIEPVPNELVLRETAERIGVVVRTDVTLRHDEKRDDSGPSGGDEDRNTTAHAVANKAALAQLGPVDQRNDRSCVVLEPVWEIDRLVAIAVPQEVNEQGSTPT